MATIRERISATLEQPMQEALTFARQQPVVYVDETGAPTGNADGGKFGAELLDVHQLLFAQWYRWQDAAIDWPQLQRGCQPIREAFEATLQWVVELGYQRSERTPWSKTVRTVSKSCK